MNEEAKTKLRDTLRSCLPLWDPIMQMKAAQPNRKLMRC
jgi:hypothetical protein